jgi:hypothetical protein
MRGVGVGWIEEDGNFRIGSAVAMERNWNALRPQKFERKKR